LKKLIAGKKNRDSLTKMQLAADFWRLAQVPFPLYLSA
jgi:hypothetical protein